MYLNFELYLISPASNLRYPEPSSVYTLSGSQRIKAFWEVTFIKVVSLCTILTACFCSDMLTDSINLGLDDFSEAKESL
jgi:hypothetical protein